VLREIVKVMQVAGEPRRRWFFSDQLDLVVWEDEDGSIYGFQLAYDKYRNEHSVSWHKDRGFTHYVVDDGEPFAGVNSTPILYADGPFERNRVLEVFHALACAVPANIAAFVEGKLREYEGPLLS